MPRTEFETVPDELLELAELTVKHFRAAGYQVTIERSDLGYPYTPTLICKRATTTTIVEVDSRLRYKRVAEWLAYGHSCTRDTRFALVLPTLGEEANRHVAELAEKGVGLYNVIDDRLIEVMAPRDLGVNIELPPLPSRLRPVLASAYEHFRHARWREGFSDACQALEDESRTYLKKHSRTGRIQIMRASGAATLSSAKINRMTLGQLALTFSEIQVQNRTDAIIARSLASINRDRVGVTHFRGKRNVVERLRRNVGQHLWTIVAALRAIREC